jgi:NDP-sugar pyrophosphorylase family protein
MNLEAPKIDQVLIAAGGKATRLVAGGIDVPDGKSLLKIGGRTLLHDVLDTKLDRGFRRFVIAAENPEKLAKINAVVESISRERDVGEIVLFQDNGLGTNGLPYQARDLLDEEFFFDFGHNDTNLGRSLAKRKCDGIVVFTGFPVTGISDHPVVHRDKETGVIYPQKTSNTEQLEVAAPFVLDHEWIEELPREGFNFAQMVKNRAERQGAIVVPDPGYYDFFGPRPEIDTPEEYFEQFSRQASQRNPEPNGEIPVGATADEILHYRDNYRRALSDVEKVQKRTRAFDDFLGTDLVAAMLSSVFDARPYGEITEYYNLMLGIVCDIEWKHMEELRRQKNT